VNPAQPGLQVNNPVFELSGQFVADSSDNRLADSLHHHLSPRQVEVLLLMLQGLSRSEIARQLNLSARTVDTTRARMMAKLNAKTNTELALKAFSLCTQRL
jgi:DNA-binding CsgD family transcriptional regulator